MESKIEYTVKDRASFCRYNEFTGFMRGQKEALCVAGTEENEMNLRIAELRKWTGLTQQELGERLSVSFQTVSKWENGVTMPDLTMIPALTECFQVSADELLGMVPLKDEYVPSDAGTKGYWQNRMEYLKLTREMIWNVDYMRFLVEQVWKIDHPVKVLDCGCGYGALGLLLLPLLPEGSSYTGMDFSAALLEEGRRILRALECQEEDSQEQGSQERGGQRYGNRIRFVEGDLFELEEKERYDLVVSQGVLRHVNHGELVLHNMVRAAVRGGLVVCIECSRELEAGGLYIDGMDYEAMCRREGLRKLWRTEYTRQGRDYAIAARIPFLMRKEGLDRVDVRMNDRVTCLYPGQDGYEQSLSALKAANGWETCVSLEQEETAIRGLMSRGMDRKGAEDYVRQQNEIARFLEKNGEKAALTRFSGIMAAYGWKG